MGKIKAVIFDWSGVLSNDILATFETSNEELELMGKPRLSMERFRELYELPWRRFYEKLGMEVDMDEEQERWARIFPKHCHKIKAFPHAKHALEWVKGKGMKVIVFSAHNEKLLKKEVEDYGFSGLIDFVDGSNQDKREKVEALVQRHEIGRESTLYVGDMRHDIETARLAGIRSVAVLSGYDPREKLESEKPDFMIENVGELPALIERLEAGK